MHMPAEINGRAEHRCVVLPRPLCLRNPYFPSVHNTLHEEGVRGQVRDGRMHEVAFLALDGGGYPAGRDERFVWRHVRNFG